MANIDTDIPHILTSPTPRPRTNNDGTVSPSQRRSAYFNQSPVELKKKLQEQLAEKASLIQVTAEHGNALLQQKEQIEQRIRELEETQDEMISPELQNKLAQLEKEAMSLDTDTRKVLMNATSQGSRASPSTNSPSNSPISSSTLEQATTSEVPPSRSAMRRQKTQQRHNDVELAAEIGQNLLKEVKRLHALLHEKEDLIKELEFEKAELERIIESLNKQLRLREDAEESLKSQVWELEVRVQSLDQERESQTIEVSRLRKEIQLQEKKLGQSTDLLEQVKAREAKLNTELDDSKAKYERQVRAQNKAYNDLKKENEVVSKALEEARQDNMSLKAKLKRKDESSAKGLPSLVNIAAENAAMDDTELNPETASSVIEKCMMTLNHVDPQAAEAVKQMFDELKVLQVKNGSLQSENEEIKNMLADREEEIERLRNENGFGEQAVIQGQKRKVLHKKKSSSLSQNSLADINEDVSDAIPEDDYDGQSEILNEEDDVDSRLKNNRPDSNMFKPRPVQGREKRISSTRLRNSIQPEDESENEELIDVGEMIDEPIINGFDETLERPVHQDPEAVEAARAETLEALTKQKSLARSSKGASRGSKNISSIPSFVDEPEIIPGTEGEEVAASPRNSKSRGSVVQERISKYETIAQANKRLSSVTGSKGEYDDEDAEYDASSVENYTSARQSSASKIEENIDERGDSKKASKHMGLENGDEGESNIDPIDETKSSKRAGAVSPSNRSSAIGVVKDGTNVRTEISFMEVGVQTVLSTAEVGIQTDALFEEDIVCGTRKSDSLSAGNYIGNNNLAENRFTLDLAANANNAAKAKAQNSKIIHPQSPTARELQHTFRQNPASRPTTPPPRPTNKPPQNLLITVQNAQNGQQPPVPISIAQNNGHQNRSNIVAIAKGKQKEDFNIQNQQAAAAANSHHQHTGSLDSVSSGSTVSSSASSNNYREVKRNSNSSQNGEDIQPSSGKSRFDQAVLQAITQTMMGETLHKYTRRNFGGERRHARYFWVHPYSRTLYWSAKDPNGIEMSDSRSKTPMLATQAAYIQSVQQVPDGNSSNLHNMSIVVKTPNPKHEIKFTAATKEIHDTWFRALTFLTEQIGTDSLGNQINSRQIQQGGGSPNATLRPSNLPAQDLKKKSSFSKLTALMRRDASSSLTRGLTSPLQHEQHDQENLSVFDDDFENVRECCDGRHNVNDLAKGRRN